MKTLKEKTVENVAKFIGMDLDEQRKFLSLKDRSKKKEAEACIRSICDIIRNIVSDVKLVKYFILLLDGMIEGIVGSEW